MPSVIHIGANKAASTTLQRKLFAQHPDLSYVGWDGSDFADYNNLYESLLWTDDLFWDEPAARQFFHTKLDAARGRTFVFSAEDIMTSHIASQCLTRLRDLIGTAKVLIVIRNQLDAAISYYASHGAYLRWAPRPYFKRFVQLDDWLDYCTSVIAHGPIAGLDYARYLNRCETLFGQGSITILLFEDLIRKPERFYANLSEALDLPVSEVAKYLDGTHERQRQSARRRVYHRFRSSFLWNVTFHRRLSRYPSMKRHLDAFLDQGKRVEISLPEPWQERLSKRFAAGNQMLVDRFGLPLAEYSYPLLT